MVEVDDADVVDGGGVAGANGWRTSLKGASFLKMASLKKPSLKMLPASTMVVVAVLKAALFPPGVTSFSFLISTALPMVGGRAL